MASYDTSSNFLSPESSHCTTNQRTTSLDTDSLRFYVKRHFTQDTQVGWIAPEHTAISYPAAGNEDCFQIEDASFWFRHRNKCLLEWVRTRSISGVFLDIGGGNGFVTQALCGAGVDAWLMEPGPDGCANARRRGIETVLCSTLQDAHLPEASIGAVGMFDVLEHIREENDFLCEVRRVLKPGGWLFATVPAFPWLWSASDDAAGHERRYTHASARAAMEKAGFVVDRMTYFFMVLLPPLFALRTLPYRLRGQGKAKNMLNESTEHGTEGGGVPNMIERTLAWEAKVLARPNGYLPFGTSLIFAAKKPD